MKSSSGGSGTHLVLALGPLSFLSECGHVHNEQDLRVSAAHHYHLL